ncbi:MAG TPA: hypothetical protein VFR67_24585 [Pilimelia sp.]|nr:hypothetical protein [Pilimelia sp.]
MAVGQVAPPGDVMCAGEACVGLCLDAAVAGLDGQRQAGGVLGLSVARPAQKV